MPFSSQDNVPYGVSWNTDANYTQGKTLSRWAAEQPWNDSSFSMEIPFANSGAATFTPDKIRAFGKALAEVFLKFYQFPTE